MSRALAMLLMVFASTSARAEQPHLLARQPPAGEPPVEVGLAIQQMVLGTVTGIIAGGGAVALGAGSPWGLPFAATAVLPGYSVCVIGQSSAWYEGSCAAPVVGALLGALGIGVPAGAWAWEHVSDQQMWPVFVAAVAGAVGSALGATVGWHVSKHRRSAKLQARVVPAAAPRAAWPEMSLRALTPVGRTVSLPLLGFAF